MYDFDLVLTRHVHHQKGYHHHYVYYLSTLQVIAWNFVLWGDMLHEEEYKKKRDESIDGFLYLT